MAHRFWKKDEFEEEEDEQVSEEEEQEEQAPVPGVAKHVEESSSEGK